MVGARSQQRIDTIRQLGEVLDLTGAATLGQTIWVDVARLGLVGDGGSSRVRKKALVRS